MNIIHKPRVTVFQIDTVLNHMDTLLFRHRTDWSNLKGFVGRRNLQFKKTKVEELTLEVIGSIGEKEWSACCKHAIDIQQEFWRRDIAV